MSRIRLHAPHDPIAVALKLKEALRLPPPADATEWVMGNGTEARMRLFRRRRWIANSFAPVLVAAMAAEGAGTLIEGRIGVVRGVKLFMALWFGLLTMVTLASVPFLLILATAVQGAPGAFAAIPLLGGVPLTMIAIGVGMIVWGRWMARNDAAVILAFLERTIDARISDPAPAAPRAA